jgi:RND family efflux transporter MFP subunit
MRLLTAPAFCAALCAALLAFSPARAETITLQPTKITDWKAVYGRIEARDRIPARARLGGTLVELTVTEGDLVEAGKPLARIVDEKLNFQRSALSAQRSALSAQLDNAQNDLGRGEALLKQGVSTVQRLDALRTQVDVLKGQIAALDAQSEVITQQEKEGSVLAPVSGRVLDVPVAKGGVVMPGETVASRGGGGTFLRIAVPERHATHLHEGDQIEIEQGDDSTSGKLQRVYPLIENGRVIADVQIEGLSDRFVDARVLVRLPVGEHEALVVPASAIVTRSGLDFVAVENGEGAALRTIVPGTRQKVGEMEMVEVLSGLQAGDRVLTQIPAGI